MKYKIERRATGNLERLNLEDFCAEHRLSLRVAETVPSLWPGQRYVASIPYLEVMERGMLGGPAGYGATPEQAIGSFVAELAGKEVAIRAYTDSRVNVVMPDVVDVGELEREP